MGSSDQPREKTVSEAAVAPPDDVTEIDLRQFADRLLEVTRVEYVDDGVLLVMNPPAAGHRAIIRLLVEAILMAVATKATPVRWSVDSENFQWELPGQSERFYVPDIVVSHPGASTPEEERAAIVLIAEVTSLTSADTVYNDRVVKPRQYAKADIPLYLLVDQERTAWTLFGLGAKSGYQVLAAGKFGESVPLPAPLGFSIPTAEWPNWPSGTDSV
jgi:Uma2 family endonuclease